jgi:hypothetical protein
VSTIRQNNLLSLGGEVSQARLQLVHPDSVKVVKILPAEAVAQDLIGIFSTS